MAKQFIIIKKQEFLFECFLTRESFPFHRIYFYSVTLHLFYVKAINTFKFADPQQAQALADYQARMAEYYKSLGQQQPQ